MTRAAADALPPAHMDRWPTGFDAARSGTADLLDLFHHKVDAGTAEQRIQIVEAGLLRCGCRPSRA